MAPTEAVTVYILVIAKTVNIELMIKPILNDGMNGLNGNMQTERWNRI